MNLQRKNRLEEAGVDVAQALERMMGSETLLERLLAQFLEDKNYLELCAALDDGDLERAVSASHALKGVCGNLSMTRLFQLFTAQVNVLRAGDLAAACGMMKQISSVYGAVVAAIQEGTL